MVGLEKKTLSLGRSEGVVEGISTVLFGEGDDLDTGFERSHLGNESLCRAGLVAVHDKAVSLGKPGFQKSKGKGRAVSL
jgi:hypothetical protein